MSIIVFVYFSQPEIEKSADIKTEAFNKYLGVLLGLCQTSWEYCARTPGSIPQELLRVLCIEDAARNSWEYKKLNSTKELLGV